jgi:hypothetical protein
MPKGNDMLEPMLKFSVTCPNCALESVSEMPIALIANALLTGKAIRLRAECHDEYWTATIGEREQIRSALREIRVDMPTATLRTHTERALKSQTAPQSAAMTSKF